MRAAAIWLLSQHLYYILFHVMNMCHVCYYKNSDARSLKSSHKDSTTNWQSVCNLHRFQDLVYAENSDVICVNETWLNQNISISEMLQLHSGFTIFRRDRSDRGGGIVLITIKTASSKAVKEFKPESEAELQQLQINFTGQIILF